MEIIMSANNPGTFEVKIAMVEDALEKESLRWNNFNTLAYKLAKPEHNEAFFRAGKLYVTLAKANIDGQSKVDENIKNFLKELSTEVDTYIANYNKLIDKRENLYEIKKLQRNLERQCEKVINKYSKKVLSDPKNPNFANLNRDLQAFAEIRGEPEALKTTRSRLSFFSKDRKAVGEWIVSSRILEIKTSVINEQDKWINFNQTTGLKALKNSFISGDTSIYPESFLKAYELLEILISEANRTNAYLDESTLDSDVAGALVQLIDELSYELVEYRRNVVPKLASNIGNYAEKQKAERDFDKCCEKIINKYITDVIAEPSIINKIYQVLNNLAELFGCEPWIDLNKTTVYGAVHSKLDEVEASHDKARGIYLS